MSIYYSKEPVFKHTDIEFCAVPVPQDIDDFKADSSVEFTSSQIAAYSQSQTHPSIVYAPSGFNGHKWWLATTPYPSATEVFEDPCIYYADDRANGDPPIEFTPISGTASGDYTVINNPVVKVSSNKAINSDPDIEIINDGNNTPAMWLISRNNLPVGTHGLYTTWAQKSLTGQAWTERDNMIYAPADLGIPGVGSAAIVVESNKIINYAISGSAGIVTRPDPVNARGYHMGLYILEGTTFENGGDFVYAGKGYIGGNKEIQPWHIDVTKYDGKYYMICCAQDVGSSYQLPMYTYLAESTDGLNFYLYSRPIVDHYGYYRPTICVTNSGELVIYISTTGANIPAGDLPDGAVSPDGRYIGLVHAPLTTVLQQLKAWEWQNRD